MVVSPDGRRIMILDKGKGKQTVRFGYHPKEKSWITFIDATTLEVVARTEVGWSMSTGYLWDHQGYAGDWVFSPDGRYMTIACFGYRSQKSKETLPAELVTLNLDNGEVARRLILERPIDSLIATTVVPWPASRGRPPAPVFLDDPDYVEYGQLLYRHAPEATAAVVYSMSSAARPKWQRETKKKQPPLPAELFFVDLENLELQKTVPLQGEPLSPAVSPDGGYLYLLEPGSPDKKPEKNINGRVQVISLANRAYETSLDVGSGLGRLIVDEEGEQVFVLSQREPSGKKEKKEDRPGLLHVIRAAYTVAKLEVGWAPLFVKITPDREKVYVVSQKSLAAVDVVALRNLEGGELKQSGISWLTQGSAYKGASELAITSDGRRGYVLYAGSSKLVVFDLEENVMLAELTAGRGGVKFGKFLGDVAAGKYYNVAAASTTIVFGPDEKFVYVLNTNSNDVTIVDAETNQIVETIGVGGDVRRMTLLPGGKLVAVRTGFETLHLIDTSTRKKVEERKTGGNFFLSPNGKYAVAHRNEKIQSFEGSTLKTIATTAEGKFNAIALWVFALPMEEPEPVTH